MIIPSKPDRNAVFSGTCNVATKDNTLIEHTAVTNCYNMFSRGRTS